jgi:hypothetical protein
MISELTEEQRDVLDEYVKDVKRTNGFPSPSDFHYRRSYANNYGEGEEIELLNDNIYELIQNNDFTDAQKRKLAKIISRREVNWFVSDDIKGIDPKLLIEQGNGYIILVDGTRIDDSRALVYKRERDKYNAIRQSRLANSKTNGTEFLNKN